MMSWLTCKCSENCPRAKRLALRTTWLLSERLWHTVCSTDDSILQQHKHTDKYTQILGIFITHTSKKLILSPHGIYLLWEKNDETQHTWCVCDQHILQPTQQDTWCRPSSDRGFHWQGRPEWGASNIIQSTWVRAVTLGFYHWII